MAVLTIIDRADQFRIEINGALEYDAVEQLRECWSEALSQPSQRKFVVDITLLSGYDLEGLHLLHDMYCHGTHIAARTPQSLQHLNFIAACAQARANQFKRPVAQVQTVPYQAATA